MPECLDNTLKSIERIALNNSFDSWIMLNVYPQRATNPDDLHREMNSELHKLNTMHIKRVLEEYRPLFGLLGEPLLKDVIICLNVYPISLRLPINVTAVGFHLEKYQKMGILTILYI